MRALRSSLLLLVSLAGCAVAPAPAPLRAPGPPRAEPAATEGGRIHVDAENLQVTEVMERIGRAVGRTILVDPTVQETVTVSLRDMSWREAVDVIARMTRCEVEERPGGVLVLTQCGRRIGCYLDANVRTLVQLVCAYEGAKAILPPDLQGRVTPPAELTGDVGQMVRQLLAPLPDEYRVIVERGGTLVRVLAPTISGAFLGHDEETLWLLHDDGRYVQLRLPPASATGAPGERRQALLRALRLARRGDRIRARCAWRGDAPELVELLEK